MSEAISQEQLEAALAEIAETKPAVEEPEVIRPPEAPQINSIEELRRRLQVKPPDQIVSWINALIFGDPGAGKTWLGGTAEDDERTGPLLVLDIEGGVTTLRNRPNVDVISIRSMAEMEKTHANLYHSIKDDKLYYGTIMIDSLPELADIDMRLIMKQAFSKNPETVDIDVPSPREWGKQRNHMRLIVRAFRDLPCNVIYTAQAGYQQDEGQPTKVHPAFAGKLRIEVPGFMDIVGYLYPKVDPITMQVTRYLQTTGTQRVIAKDRTDTLGVLTNPSIPMIWDLINSNPEAQQKLAKPIPELEQEITANE